VEFSVCKHRETLSKYSSKATVTTRTKKDQDIIIGNRRGMEYCDCLFVKGKKKEEERSKEKKK
jgi:hypothetical protein